MIRERTTAIENKNMNVPISSNLRSLNRFVADMINTSENNAMSFILCVIGKLIIPTKPVSFQ